MAKTDKELIQLIDPFLPYIDHRKDEDVWSFTDSIVVNVKVIENED